MFRRATCGVYAIVNLRNGKLYIGSSADIRKRWNEHRRKLSGNKHTNQHLQNAFNRDGADAFEYRLLEEIADPSDLLAAEQYWIERTRCTERDYGYNLHLDARRFIPPDETRARMSESHRGKPHSEEHRHRLSEVNIGKRHSPTVIERLRDIARNRSPEHLARISEANGRFTPEEVIEIRRKAQYQSITSIAREYGVSHSVISDIVRRKTWKHLP